MPRSIFFIVVWTDGASLYKWAWPLRFVEHGMSATYGLERNWMKPTTLFSNPCQMQHQKWAAHERQLSELLEYKDISRNY
ncbi:hypothetical protein Hanom_Chr01g00082261 [Helianthus anomalus]